MGQGKDKGNTSRLALSFVTCHFPLSFKCLYRFGQTANNLVEHDGAFFNCGRREPSVCAARNARNFLALRHAQS
jgi:hypothetical protein